MGDKRGCRDKGIAQWGTREVVGTMVLLCGRQEKLQRQGYCSVGDEMGYGYCSEGDKRGCRDMGIALRETIWDVGTWVLL